MTLRPTASQDRGAAAVEFAILLPVLLLLIFGMVDFARGFNAHISLSGAAREGARAQALGRSPAEIDSITRGAAPTLPAGDITVTALGCTVGAPGEVRASYDFPLVTPVSSFMAWFGGSGPSGTIPITGIGVMRCGG